MSSSSSSSSSPSLPGTVPSTTTNATTRGSLTPLYKSDESVHEANMEGIMNGLLTLFPLTITVSLLVRNNVKFAKHTNWQSRTALILMPSMFVAALTSEQKLLHHMREIARTTQHNNETVRWAEEQLKKEQQQEQQSRTRQELQTQHYDIPSQHHSNSNNNSIVTETQQLALLYQESVQNSGVNIVPGTHLQWYHHAANYTQQYPVRVVSALALPSVAYIFYGQHTKVGNITLPFSQKVLHTRVIGQFTTLCILLGVMGFKEYMDHNGGQYISQYQADQRVAEMQSIRQHFLEKIEQEQREKEELELLYSTNKDTNDEKDISQTTNTKKKKKQIKKKEENLDVVSITDATTTTNTNP